MGQLRTRIPAAAAFLSLVICGMTLVLWIDVPRYRFVLTFDTRGSDGLTMQNTFSTTLTRDVMFDAYIVRWGHSCSHRVFIPYWTLSGATALWPAMWLRRARSRQQL